MVDIAFRVTDDLVEVLINGRPDKDLQFNKAAWLSAKKTHQLTPEIIGKMKQKIKQAVRDTPLISPEQAQQIVTRFFREIDG
jgi:hypothetical protein